MHMGGEKAKSDPLIIREDRGEVGNQVTRVPARAGVRVVVVTSVSVAMVPPPRTAYTNRVKEAAIHTCFVEFKITIQLICSQF